MRYSTSTNSDAAASARSMLRPSGVGMDITDEIFD